MLPLLLAPVVLTAPINETAITTLEEHRIIVTDTQQIEPPKEYTLEEKITLNINNCNTDTQYIRADNAECLDKPVYIPPTPKKPTRQAVNASNGYYPKGQCTEYVSRRRPVGEWGNASNWKRAAQRDGFTISSTPIAGAIGQSGNHVVYVESVHETTVTISEANYDYRGSIRTIEVPISKYTYIY